MHDQLFKDVTAKKELKREAPYNPQDPKYKIRDENNDVIEYGEVKGSKPTVQYYRTNQDDIKANTVKGIDYATPGTALLGNFKTRDRRDIRPTHDIADIQGAQVKPFYGIRIPSN